MPAASDVPIFQRLVEWWAALQRWKTLDLGCEHQIGGDEGLDSAHDHQKTSRRPHLLISEAGSTAAPQGYFDCTVEARRTQFLVIIHSLIWIDFVRSHER